MEAKTTELKIQGAVTKLKKEFIPEFLRRIKGVSTLPNGAVVVGGNLLPGSQTDLDLCLGSMSGHKRQEVLQSLKALARAIIARENFSWIEISTRALHEYIGIQDVVIRITILVKTKTQPVLTTPMTLVEKTFTHVIGVVDLIFQSFHNLPQPLFQKGCLFQWVGHPLIASRGNQRVEEVMADAKKKKTKINLSRAEELVKSKQARKILWKCLTLYLRGWVILNCKLKAVVPKHLSDQVEAQWLARTTMGGMERWLKSFLSQVKFYILHRGKKIPIASKEILSRVVLQDNLTFSLPNGVSVPAFDGQTNWSDTKELDKECIICKEGHENWKEKTVCWRSLQCPHVMCCTCHEKARGGKYEKYCPTCRHPISKMAC